MAEQLLAHPDPIHAPDLLLLEVANALWLKMRRDVLLEAEGRASLEWLRELSLILWRVASALNFARHLDHAVYDCVYLSLAWHIDAQVVTADGRFRDRTERDRELRGHVVMLDEWTSRR